MKDYYTILPGLRATASTMDYGPLGTCITSIEVREQPGGYWARTPRPTER